MIGAHRASCAAARGCAIVGAIIIAIAGGIGACASYEAGPPFPSPVGSTDHAVVALGNLRTGAPPGKLRIELSSFLFGEEPDPGLALFKPMDVYAVADGLLISDAGLGAVLEWRAESKTLAGAALADPPRSPGEIAIAPNGDRLVADSSMGAVLRYDAAGRFVRRFTLSASEPMRPGGILCVGAEIWITNTAAHRIEVFSAGDAQHLRSIGRRGRGPGEFGFPLGLAQAKDGSILVVDMLGCRVQMLDRTGAWLRDIGGPGDRTGYFGRPRDVAVGPDGVIFVSDAASQRVHAFEADGAPLLAFGGPDDGADPLVLPAGIAVGENIERVAPNSSATSHSERATRYFVFVAEQMHNPGVRVYSWRKHASELAVRQPRSARSEPSFVASPHWQPAGCAVCHAPAGAAPAAISAKAADALCLRCHDGNQASREPHPIGWPAEGARTKAPPGWPLVDGRVGCLTCHDVRRHCDHGAVRPRVNPAMVRGFEPRDPMAACQNCHITDSWRTNPHRSAKLNDRQSCAFCHTNPPPIPPDGRPREQALLRADTNRVCQTCHVMHADPAPNGHLGALVSDEIRAALRTAAARLPLENDRVTCATCHNPHDPSLFAEGSALGARAADARDAAIDLRADHADLCLACHAK